MILLRREGKLHPRYAALASHYVFNPLFYMPARGNEKPDTESTVHAMQCRFSTPVPRANDLEELNRYFQQRCEVKRARIVHSMFDPFVISARFSEEQASAAPTAQTSVLSPCNPSRRRCG